jgi:hypothetical protein
MGKTTFIFQNGESGGMMSSAIGAAGLAICCEEIQMHGLGY